MAISTNNASLWSNYNSRFPGDINAPDFRMRADSWATLNPSATSIGPQFYQLLDWAADGVEVLLSLNTFSATSVICTSTGDCL